jgi:hypothetical protein
MHPYQNIEAVLTTKHGKLELFQEAFQELDLKIKAVELDTDVLGTFSKEIPRLQSPLETALAKAKMGLAASKARLGFASEGSIGSDALIPFANSDVEIAVLVDDETGVEIWESFRSLEIVAFQREVDQNTDLSELLTQIDFPNQRLIASSVGIKASGFIKGIGQVFELEEAISQLSSESPSGKVLLEPDFRAHYCPSRSLNIRRAAELLAKRVAALCPECRSPGFGRIKYETGLHCNSCGLLNEDAITYELLCCVKCEHQERGNLRASSLSPEHCNYCNP